MTLNHKRIIIAVLAFLFLASLVFVQRLEVARRYAEVGLTTLPIVVPASSQQCVVCHHQANPGIVDHWKDSKHARSGVGCADCHHAEESDADAFIHYAVRIATVTTPRDCARYHGEIAAEFAASHHAAAGDILASLDNFLAETVEGAPVPFDPHSPLQ
jgi:hydroxylamine dehydrogenase